MLKKPNFESQPMIIEGHKAWHIGKDPAGKEVYQLEKGFLKLKNGKTEYGEAVDDDGNFVVTEQPETEEEPEPEEAKEPPKGGKKK
ncbi:MAG: hypothetical protein IJ306_10795 [Oscillospiraceae bacterium]|nr:hypothetical protein [Oscillospiraceae bacterium]